MSGDRSKSAPRFVDDLLGGSAAMLVAFPSAIAFGLLVYASLGASHATQGAMYGMIGALSLGIVAAVFGGRPGNISAPCAPAAAVLAALVMEIAGGRSPEQVIAILGLVSLGAAAIQILIGILGGGRLIKFIPYPVVSGYLAGVGLLIVGSQLGKLVSLPAEVGRWSGLTSPGLWSWKAGLIGGVTMLVMLVTPKVTKKVPAPILGLVAGILTYGGLALAYPELRILSENALVIGSLGGGGLTLESFLARFRGIGELGVADLGAAAVPALTLAVLLSIDSLKTSVLVDSLTRSRHDSDRELRAQGLGNATAALLGGMPGAATAGPTLVNVSSGGRTRRSGIVTGVMSLAAFVALAQLVAWVPQAALAGILIVIGFRMVDTHSFDLLKRKSTVLDFFVVAAVVATALLVNLIMAAAVGLVLSIVLFVREQIRGNVVRRWLPGSALSSKKRRLPEQKDLLLREGGEGIALFQLQGNLFFGTTDQLFSELESHIAAGRTVILDLSRVGFLDFTAGRMIHQIAEQLEENGGVLALASLNDELTPYLKHFDVIGSEGSAKVFPDADEALGWAEDRILEAAGLLEHVSAPPLSLSESYLFQELSPEQLTVVQEVVEERTYAPGERIFSCGDPGETLFMVRRGSVRIVLPLEGEATKHLATFGRANFFGDMAFLSPSPRSAHAEAVTETQVFSLSREASIGLAADHPEIGSLLFARLGKALARRLRTTNAEVRSLADA